MKGYVMDLTQTGNFGASLGAVTFIDPDFDWDDDGINDWSITLRAGDKIIYTEIGQDGSFDKFATKATPTSSDFVLIQDAADSDKIKKAAFPTGAGGVTDGDKGEVVVTGGVWTIDSGVVDSDNIVDGSVTETDLNASVNASLNLADTASQPGHTHVAANITDFDTEVSNNTDVTANTAKISYTDAPVSAANTTTITLDNAGGERYVASANAATDYTVSITGGKVGAWAKVLINTTSEPTVNTVSTGKIAGATWVTGTDMYMVIFTDDGTNINYYFLEK